MRYDVSIRQDNHLFSRSLPVSYICPNFFISTYPNSRLSQTPGGFAQYVSWCDTTHPHSISDFTAFELFTSRFYSDPSIYPACQSLYQHHIRTVLTRRNTFNGNLYKEDPVIFAWELANEP